MRSTRVRSLLVTDSTYRPARRFGPILNGYVAREILSPTLIALLGLTVLILTKDLLHFADLIINRGFGVGVVALIAVYEVIPLAAHTLPFAVLIGTLIGLGRLRTDLEILAIEAAGIASRQLVVPVLRFAAVAMLIGLFLTLWAAPWAITSLDTSLRQMIAENPGLALRSGTVYDFSGVKVLAREVSARGDQLRGVLLWLPDQGQTIFAEDGALQSFPDGTSQLLLHDGVMLAAPRWSGEETRFGTYQQPLRENPARLRRDEDALTDEPLEQLIALARGGADDDITRLRAQIELQHRFSYPAAALVFGMLAVGLSRVGRYFSRAVGGVTGLVVTIVYYGLMQLGEGLIQASAVTPLLGVWLANITVCLLAIAILWKERWWLIRQRKYVQEEDEQQPPQQRQRRFFRFPGYLLQRYVTRQYLVLLSLSFALLFVGYLLVDILERLQWFARHQATALEALRFYGARSPLLASQVIPMSLLLATALTVSTLSAHRELTAMRSCGVAVIHALVPILLIAGLVTPGYFLLNEIVVPRTNTLAYHLKEEEIKNRGPDAYLHRLMIWYQDNRHLSQATQLNPQLGEAQELSIYELGKSGLPISRTDARSAKYIGNGMWELLDPIKVSISEQGVHELPADTHIQLGEAPATTVDTAQLGVRQLVKVIADAEASGYRTTTYRVDFNVKLAAPFACLLLPAAALFFAVSGPPFPGPAVTILTCSALGVGYILLTGVAASLGYGGALPPPLAGWGPVLLLAGLAMTLMMRGKQ